MVFSLHAISYSDFPRSIVLTIFTFSLRQYSFYFISTLLCLSSLLQCSVFRSEQYIRLTHLIPDFPIRHTSDPIYPLRSFIILLSIFFTPAILRIQFFPHTCSLLHLLAGTSREFMTFLLKYVQIILYLRHLFIYIGTLFSTLFASACIVRRPFSGLHPSRYKKCLKLKCCRYPAIHTNCS